MDGQAEALVVCSDKSMGAGITVWDMDAGHQLLHIPTCASPPHGLLCLSNQFLVASQVHKHGSLGGGTIFMWPLSKPRSPLRSYPMEAIGPLSSTKDGLYIVGGALSGNAYVWEVSSGRLLKSWCAHTKTLNCLTISDDNSLLISGSDDGLIRVWSMISLLDVADWGGLPDFLHSWLAHQSAVTGLLFISGSSSLVLVSSSLDGTCKVWDLVSGKLLQSRAFPLAVTAIVLDPGEQLFSGSADGRIFVDMVDIGLGEDSAADSEDHMMVLSGHKASITALTFSSGGLMISACEDCSVCLWDVSCWVVIRTFNHQKGRITNMVIVPQSSLFPGLENHQGFSYQLCVSVLEKYLQPASASRGPVTHLPTSCFLEDSPINTGFRSTDSMNKQILDLEQGLTLSALQMKVETSVQNRMWALSMTKHVTEMNRQLRSRLLAMMHCRLSPSLEFDTSERRKKIKLNSLPQPGEEQPKSQP